MIECQIARAILAFLCTLMGGAVMLLLPGCKHSTDPGTFPDTTSHAIVWRTDTIGFGASQVSDIAIIDENNIWAVGEFYLYDSLGKPDPNRYNVLQWDGQKWNPKRLSFTYAGFPYVSQTTAIFAFSANDIWLCSGWLLHWDGARLDTIPLSGVNVGYISKFWGTSSTDMYIAGQPGTFCHYDGQTLRSIATGVQSSFNDLWGSGDKVYVSSYKYDNQIRPSGVFLYYNSRFQFLFPDVSDSSLFRAVADAFGVWVSPTGELWCTGEQYVFRPLRSHSPLPGLNPQKQMLHSIRGLADNDVWVTGIGGYVAHFNGGTWREYAEVSNWNTEYHCMAVKGNTVALGGYRYDPYHAVVTIGKRR